MQKGVAAAHGWKRPSKPRRPKETTLLCRDHTRAFCVVSGAFLGACEYLGRIGIKWYLVDPQTFSEGIIIFSEGMWIHWGYTCFVSCSSSTLILRTRIRQATNLMPPPCTKHTRHTSTYLPQTESFAVLHRGMEAPRHGSTGELTSPELGLVMWINKKQCNSKSISCVSVLVFT